MKITNEQLRQIIKEELEAVLDEATSLQPFTSGTTTLKGPKKLTPAEQRASDQAHQAKIKRKQLYGDTTDTEMGQMEAPQGVFTDLKQNTERVQARTEKDKKEYPFEEWDQMMKQTAQELKDLRTTAEDLNVIRSALTEKLRLKEAMSDEEFTTLLSKIFDVKGFSENSPSGKREMLSKWIGGYNNDVNKIVDDLAKNRSVLQKFKGLFGFEQ